ncbi:hypothetical protein psyc5s11_38950 [Clostridium gelidum]|uniref:Cytochrome b5 heme-binding domain-containing protein n=1 Tax=Clostridium gelidum TaxID=704125 RepID=A0ABM7T8V6_9CLOT|nr:cytochrome b5 domain-containing protein [Clostridium gelidum]BCZ47828.1 hypothetical protein psyc5s11_38950 [Clostridium gelidum]
MSIYFDFKTINELTGNNYYRQQKEFTLEDLAQYTGRNGYPAYVAIEGIVYDISNSEAWGGGTHFGLTAGQDLTSQFNSCRGIIDILTNAPKVGILIDEEDMSDINDMNNMSNMNYEYTMPMNRQASQDKSKFTPDDWIRYITPLVVYALREPSQGTNTQRLYQKAILLGVLVGLGKTPQEAITQVQQWQNTGASQILKSGTGTTSGMGTGGSAGTGFGMGSGTSGSTSTGGGTGITGGMGTGFGMGPGTSGSTSAGGGAGTLGTGFGTPPKESTGTSGSTNTSNRLQID